MGMGVRMKSRRTQQPPVTRVDGAEATVDCLPARSTLSTVLLKRVSAVRICPGRDLLADNFYLRAVGAVELRIPSQ
jgi:hypothetical protein